MATAGVDEQTGQIAIYLSPAETRELARELALEHEHAVGMTWVLGEMLSSVLKGLQARETTHTSQ